MRDPATPGREGSASRVSRAGQWYEQNVLPRVIDKACSTKAFRAERRNVVAGLSGTVLEIGFGSGLNLPVYPREVDRLLVVDPAPLGRRLAAERIAAAPFPVEDVGLDGAQLDLEDSSVDHVVSTFTLCTIERVEDALAEVHRVLRPGGTFRALEHGLSDTPKIAAWQHRLTPIQRRVAGGCHLDRPILALIEGAGFRVDHVQRWSAGRPRPYTELTMAVARPV
jgi:ubiquinone/menaquinone biosynthesis C-methylase UbiE